MIIIAIKTLVIIVSLFLLLSLGIKKYLSIKNASRVVNDICQSLISDLDWKYQPRTATDISCFVNQRLNWSFTMDSNARGGKQILSPIKYKLTPTEINLLDVNIRKWGVKMMNRRLAEHKYK